MEDQELCELTCWGAVAGWKDSYTMWDLYQQYWKPFGELLTDMEKEGMMVDRCCSQPLSTPTLARCLQGAGLLPATTSDLFFAESTTRVLSNPCMQAL